MLPSPNQLRGLALCALGMLPPLASAQTGAPAASTTPPLAFEVVSVKENPGPNYEFMGAMPSPDGLHAVQSLHALIAIAYGVRPEFVLCKAAVCDSPVYDIRARVPDEAQGKLEKLDYAAKFAMLQPVLEERFGLKFHRELRDTNVYDLEVAKGGPKFHESPPGRSGRAENGRFADGTVSMSSNPNATTYRASAVDLDGFIKLLSNMQHADIGRPIVDKTGLTGKYDFELRWSPVSQDANPDRAQKADDTKAPPLFAALPSELGLVLKPAKQPQTFLVVDAIHAPTPD